MNAEWPQWASVQKGLATVVLSVEPSLLVGDPEDPITVWRKLANQTGPTAQAALLAIEGR